jgi:hypothetical protein
VSDESLRALERRARESPDDAQSWARYVRALGLEGAEAPDDLREKARRVRACLAQAPSEGLIEVGDEVWVHEHDSPIIAGRWRGRVRAVLLELDKRTGKLALRFRVWPLALDDPLPEIAWRIQPTSEWLVAGVPLSSDDRIEFISRTGSTRSPSAQ